ncbi:hypothetical protein EAF04_001984 [Stromatinia cepivora]|nr:hypothetical protein EAF04_001984 [Stromatinia cepivora]
MSSEILQLSNFAASSQVIFVSMDKDGDIVMGGIEDPKEITVIEILKVALPDRQVQPRRRQKRLGRFQPYLKDYFTNLNEPKRRMRSTQTIFGKFDGFKKEIRRVFGNINELRDAESKIYGLKQTGSAVKYAVEFRRYIGTYHWMGRERHNEPLQERAQGRSKARVRSQLHLGRPE